MSDSSISDSRPTRLVLDSIETSIRRIGHDAILQSLQNGIPLDSILAQLDSVALPITRDIADFYSWRDGSSTDAVSRIGDMYFLPGFYILPLAEAVLNYSLFLSDGRWGYGWLPIFADGGGDFIFVDLSAESLSPVRHFRTDETEHPVEYGSLRAMLRTVDEAYTAGVINLDQEGFLDMDYEAFARIAARLNPEISWWK